MSDNNYVDKTYLALELTKLSCSNTSNITDARIYKTFTYFLQKLTNIDDLGIIEDYKNEIENLRKQNKLLSSQNQDIKLVLIYLKSMLITTGEIWSLMLRNNC